jgi:ribosomal protein S18 acetylase RimI-like enzyme
VDERKFTEYKKIKLIFQQIKIRPYSKEDYQFTHDLHRENMIDYVNKYWGGWDSDIYKKDICPKLTWMIDYEGEKAGFFVLSLEKKAHLRNVQISPSFQNKGLGSWVLDYCEQACVKEGFNFLYLEVFRDNPAKILYERLGFEVYKVTKSHYMMKKELNCAAENNNRQSS